MFRDITLGQYYPADSVLHRMDPRTKLFGTMIYIVSLFVCNSWIAYAIAVAALAAVIILSRVPVSFMFRGLKAILILLLISVFFNLFFTGGEVIFRLWFIQVTREGLRTAVWMAVRLVCLVTGASLMTLTTTPNSLTDGLEKSLGFLKAIKVPVHEIAMMMSIALRFIPILVEETDKIMKAQMARGADFEEGGLIAKARAMIPLLIPLFISAFRRATELAVAMEARCYHGGEGRTKLKPLRYSARDRVAYVTIILFLILIILIKIKIK